VINCVQIRNTTNSSREKNEKQNGRFFGCETAKEDKTMSGERRQCWFDLSGRIVTD
jgi:hypothetical protein